jgi:Fructose-2,6-bisphosphatase
MCTNIYFIRHSISDSSVKDEKSRPLTDIGIIKAKNLIPFFNSISISSIYASPYKRVIQTIEPIANNKGLNIKTDDRLRERAMGMWVEDFRSFSHKQWEDKNYKIGNGESLYEVQKRNIEAVNETIKNGNSGNIIIGTHGTALSILMNWYDKNFDFHKFWEIIDQMPYVIHAVFNDEKLERWEEIVIE